MIEIWHQVAELFDMSCQMAPARESLKSLQAVLREPYFDESKEQGCADFCEASTCFSEPSYVLDRVRRWWRRLETLDGYESAIVYRDCAFRIRLDLIQYMLE